MLKIHRKNSAVATNLNGQPKKRDFEMKRNGKWNEINKSIQFIKL